MVAGIIVFLVALLAAGEARADLDLTPTPGAYKAETASLPDVVFHDGEKAIVYMPPPGWTCSGGKSAVAISIPKHDQARASIQCAAPAADSRLRPE